MSAIKLFGRHPADNKTPSSYKICENPEKNQRGRKAGETVRYAKEIKKAEREDGGGEVGSRSTKGGGTGSG